MSTLLPTLTDDARALDRVLDADVYSRLSDKAKTNLRLWIAACERVHELVMVDKAKKGAAYTKVASNIKLSADRVKKQYLAWLEGGERALIDHRCCGSRGCGLPECNNTTRVSRLTPPVIAEWQRLAETNRAVMKSGSRCFKWAWRTLITNLREGHSIPEYGTWKRIWREVKNSDAFPASCPWSDLAPPPGWSYSNFLLHQPTDTELALAQRGLGAARKTLPPVQIDYSLLRPLEAVFIDDKRIDVKVWGEFDGTLQVVELWALMALDACTRRIVGFTLHPRYTRADGSQAGIERRDVQHLLAQLLMLYGFSKSYTTELVCENAAAAVTNDFEAVLTRITGGQWRVRRSGLWDGRAMLGGFIEQGGNPNGKALIESFFGHRFDVAFGAVRGQIGGSYMLKPGDADAREREALATMKRLDGLVSDADMAVVMPYESIHSVRQHIMDALHGIETRHDHELQGFERRALWRFHEGDEFKPMDHPVMLQMLARAGGDVAVNAILAQPGCSSHQMESPAERWGRLWQRVAGDFTRLNARSFTDVWLDMARAAYRGDGRITATLSRGRSFVFEGNQHSARAGEEVMVRFDADHPENGCVLQDVAGRVLGVMTHLQRAVYGDEAALQSRFAAKEVALKQAREALNVRHSSGDALRAKIDAIDAQLEVYTTVNERTAAETVNDDTTEDLVTTWQRQRKAARKVADKEAEDLAAMITEQRAAEARALAKAC